VVASLHGYLRPSWPLQPVFFSSAQHVEAIGEVRAFQKISDTQGNFPQGALSNSDNFGCSIASLGDLDGDTTEDIAVGALYDDDGGTDHGGVYVLFLHANGTVKTEQKISDTEGNFKAAVAPGDNFGLALGGLGDLDGDATLDLVVGAPRDDGAGQNRGVVYVLFLRRNGTVRAEHKILVPEGSTSNSDLFGCSLAPLGDMDGDSIQDLAVGAYGDDDGVGGANRGAVYVLFLHRNGTVKASQKISDTEGNFQGGLGDNDNFGYSVTSLGDLDGDVTQDLAVGAYGDDDGGGTNRGAVYVLFLHPNGTVRAEQKISNTQGTLSALLDDDDRFGCSVSALGDLDGDKTTDLAVGAYGDDGRTLFDSGAVYVLFLRPDGTVKADQKIPATQGSFGGALTNSDLFGFAVAALGDVDGDMRRISPSGLLLTTTVGTAAVLCTCSFSTTVPTVRPPLHRLLTLRRFRPLASRSRPAVRCRLLAPLPRQLEICRSYLRHLRVKSQDPALRRRLVRRRSFLSWLGQSRPSA
jgi:FG-GAP repeat